MRKQFLIVSALLLVLAGCGGNQTAVPPVANVEHPSNPNGRTVKPLVFQSGKIPVQWTQFKWGDTTLTPVGEDGIVSVGGAMFYADFSSNKLIKMTMGGGTSSFHLTCSCPTAGTLFYPAAITVGGDGKLYMGTYDPTGYIGIATQTGAFSVKKIPSGDYPEFGRGTVGSDGNVWFPEVSHYMKITPAGVITEFKYADGDTSNYYGAAASGPNGDVWLSEYGESIIDDIDPSDGSETSYGLPCAPTGLISASDGNLWALCSQYLLRITPSGAYTQLNLGSLGNDGFPTAFTEGPDGNPWWTVSGQNDLATYNIALNQLNLFVPPTGFSSDYGLTAGSDGNVWALDSKGFVDVYIVNVLNFTPKPLAFTAVGQKMTIVVTEPGTSSWTASSSNTKIVTVAQGSPASNFTVTAIGAGSATVTVQDAIGNSTNTMATVTTGATRPLTGTKTPLSLSGKEPIVPR